MKIFFNFILILFFFGCSSGKVEYWCGNDPCKNKKEKEEYFKKTMTVEARIVNSRKNKKKNNIEIIMEQNTIDKNTLLEKNKLIKEDQELKRQTKLDEKKKIKNNKKFLENNDVKKNKNAILEKSPSPESLNPNNTFVNLLDKIVKKNSTRPYPDLNNIPN